MLLVAVYGHDFIGLEISQQLSLEFDRVHNAFLRLELLHALSISLHGLPNVALHNIFIIVVRVVLIVTVLHIIFDHYLLHFVEFLVMLLILHVVQEPHLLVLESLILRGGLTI